MPSLGDIWQAFVRAAEKYKEEYEKIPVIIIDNANRLAEQQPELLDWLQDNAKWTSDNQVATVVFVSSEGNVPRRMKGRFM